MKTILISAITLLPFLMTAQTVSINEFYRKYKASDEENTHMTLPGWVVKLGVGIAKGQAEGKDEKQALAMGKKIGKVRILTFEDSNPVSKKDLDRLTEGVGGAAAEGWAHLQHPDPDGLPVRRASWT